MLSEDSSFVCAPFLLRSSLVSVSFVVFAEMTPIYGHTLCTQQWTNDTDLRCGGERRKRKGDRVVFLYAVDFVSEVGKGK